MDPFAGKRCARAAITLHLPLGFIIWRTTLRAMSSLAQEVDATLAHLDPSTAVRFERLIRDAVASVRPSAERSSVSPALDRAYFDSVIGAFADVDFARPPQGDLPAARVW